jgi:hypothetical protein
MTRPRLAAAAALFALVAAPRAARAQDAEEGPSLTVYSTADPAGFDPQQFVAQQRLGGDAFWPWQVPGYGVVKEVRRVDLREGRNDLPITDVAAFIDPTTVSFTDLTDPAGTTVLEQNFQFDLVSPSKLLEKYVDREIGYETLKDGQVVGSWTGTLLSASQGRLVVRTGEGLRFVAADDPGIRLPALQDGLVTRPTLLWRLAAQKAGEHRVRTTYQTNGMTWRADYNVVLAADERTADVGAWVSLMNLSGASFRDARLKLVAGDVQRIQPRQPWETGKSGRGGVLRAQAEDAGFQEKSFFEYHLYTLPRRTDVLQNTTQQITLFPTAAAVPVQKVLVYYGLPDAAHWGPFPEPQLDRQLGSQSNRKVDVYLRFRNDRASHLGVPLPSGKLRVYKQDDADGTLEFVGEDLIDHTPKDEAVLVRLGQSFDVVGERVQADFREARAPDGTRRFDETIRVVLRNHRAEPVTVIVKENLYRWTTWEVTSDAPFTKQDARTVHFEVTVPPDGEQTVTYTVRYTW